MHQLFLAGEWTDGEKTVPVLSPYDGQEVAQVHRSGKQHFAQAIDQAVEAARELQRLPSYRIAAALERMKTYLVEHADEAALTLVAEVGKPLKFARVEVARALHIVEDGVEECKRMYGESIPLDRRPWGENRFAVVERFPRGVIGGITPFNFPLHLVAHKIIPALASRNAIVIKPASQTPLSALMWARAFEQTDLPPGTLSVLPASPEAASVLIEDDRVVARLTGRYICQNDRCQTVYSLIKGSPLAPKQQMICDDCSGQLMRRSDDNEESIVERLKTYHRHEDSLLQFYKDRDQNIIEFGVDKPLDKVFSDFKKLMGFEDV